MAHLAAAATIVVSNEERNKFGLQDLPTHLRIPFPSTGGGRGGVRAQEQHEPDSFGMVISVKEGFGFLQPIALSSSGLVEEQVYFPDREIMYRDLKVGDEVAYNTRLTPKGNQAGNLRIVDPSSKVPSGVVRGIVQKEYNVHRNTPGLIEVNIAEGNKEIILFTSEDCANGAGKSARSAVSKGDEVELVVMRVPQTSYARASAVKCLKSVREKQTAEQIKRMLDAGAQREQGVVELIKTSEGYGFIKPADRAGQIYFRFDDFVESEARESVKEGVELEFFVMAENNKGKMTDRAVHLVLLAPGTIVLESTVATKTTAVVTTEPRVHPREEPGKVLLDTPIVRPGQPDITHVELWPRCVPDGFIFRCGDRIELDVQNYRPEKINFARNVKILSFRKLGREHGRVRVVKKDQGFGFLHSALRDIDIYFRLSEVLGPNGDCIPEAHVTTNLAISFEGGVDVDKSTGTPRLKAVRCRLLSDSANITNLLEGAGGMSISGSSIAGSTNLLSKNCVGVVVTDSNKRDAPGLITIKDSDVSAAGSDDSAALLYHGELCDALDEFKNAAGWKEAVLDTLPLTRRRTLHQLLDDLYTGIAHETVVPSGLKTGGVKKFKLWKLSPEEYGAWRASRAEVPEEEDSSAISGGGGGSSGRSPRGKDERDSGDGVQFVRSDTSEEFGVLSKDLLVTFDLYFDPLSNRKVAKNVKLTDEAVPGENGPRSGVLDSVFCRGSRWGHIRVLTTEEKLSWNSSGVASGVEENKLDEGQEVTFSIRRRGGIRVAVDIRPVPAGKSTAQAEERLDGKCTAVVVDGNRVVLLDVSQCPSLRFKFWSTDIIKELSGGGASNSSSSSNLSAAAAAAAAGGDGETKFLPPLPRTAIPIDLAELAGGAGWQVGDLVECQCIANWVKSRTPLRVCAVNKLPVTGLGPKRKGTILRHQLRLRGASALAASGAPGQATEFAEIRDDSPGEHSGPSHFYCEKSDVLPFLDSESVKQGDEVEFFAVPALALALHVQTVPKVAELDGVRPLFLFTAILHRGPLSPFPCPPTSLIRSSSARAA